MFGLIKFVLFVFLFVSAFTVPLGKRTFYGHISAIWDSNETKELRSGVKQKYTEIKKTIKEDDEKREKNDKKQEKDKKHHKRKIKKHHKTSSNHKSAFLSEQRQNIDMKV